MRSIVAPMIAALAVMIPNVWAFPMGAPLALDAIGHADPIQGEAPKAWEPGKVYVVECWATWSDPCIATILHLDTLHDRFKSKGLRVIGVNVWDDDKAKVTDFVQNKGTEMSYPVLYAGKEGSSFETSWLKPGGVKELPYAFVVKDGKFLFGTHPAQLDDVTIQGLIAGGEKQEAIIQAYTAREAKLRKVDDLLKEIAQTSEAKDLATMDAKLSELEAIDPSNPYLGGLRLGFLVEKKDWPTFEKFVLEGKAEKAIQPAIDLEESSELPESTRKALLAKLLTLPSSEKKYQIFQILASRYQWLTGDKESAKITAKKMAEKPGTFPPAPLVAYSASIDEDKPQTFKEVLAAIRAAQEEQDALAPAATPESAKPAASTSKPKKKRR